MAPSTTPGGSSIGDSVTGRQVVAEEVRPRSRRAPDQQGAPVGVPAGGQLPVEVEGQLLDLPGPRVPQRELAASASLVLDEHQRVLAARLESRRGQPEAGTVPQVGHRRAVRPNEPERGMPVVAVLGVLEADQRPVEADVGDAGVLLRGVDPFGRRRRAARATRAFGTSSAEPPDLGAVVVAAPDVGGAVPPEGQAGRVAGRQRGGCRLRRAGAVERLGLPHPELVAVGVGEPPDRAAVEGDVEHPRALRPAGELTRGSPGRPGVDLPGAGAVAAEHAGLRRVPGPVRQGDPRRPEPLLPHGQGRPVVGGHGDGGHGDMVPNPTDTRRVRTPRNGCAMVRFRRRDAARASRCAGRGCAGRPRPRRRRRGRRGRARPDRPASAERPRGRGRRACRRPHRC